MYNGDGAMAEISWEIGFPVDLRSNLFFLVTQLGLHLGPY